MPVDAEQLLTDLKSEVRTLEDDLLGQATSLPDMEDQLWAEYKAGRKAGRIGNAFESWRDGILTQAAVHWVLGGVFVRFLEDNGLIDPYLAGVGDQGREADDRHAHYFQQPDHRTHNDRDYLLHAFRHVASLPDGDRLFDSEHNPVWSYPISADAARDLLAFWRSVDPDTGKLVHDFTDANWDTRFLGDLYQDLSDWAKKNYALLQTPEFVESFILDRTLEPAIREFGLAEVKLIDPTCGSGHFLLGGFHRLLDRWRRQEPGTPERALVQRALDAIYGVDLNPFAVAIARFRLLVAALKASGVKRLAQAPDFKLHVATGDSLLFGAHKGQPQLALPFGFEMEDVGEAHRILNEKYHAVVGNPPYITPKDSALRDRYRELYDSCYRQYALSVPFMERFWELAVRGENGRAAGFVGKITANSFMKREFGKKLIEEFFPTVDLARVIDTSGAYIPGHDTPTVILFGRNRPPSGHSVRAAMGLNGEPNKPKDASKGRVWTAITRQVDAVGSESAFLSVTDIDRQTFSVHPWTLNGTAAIELQETIESTATEQIGELATEIGRTTVLGEDGIWVLDESTAKRQRVSEHAVPLVIGEVVRNWSVDLPPQVIYPYDEIGGSAIAPSSQVVVRYLWPYRATLNGRTVFGKSLEDMGRPWYEHLEHYRSKLKLPGSIVFAFVGTHNHFVYDCGGKLFKQSAPIIKLTVNSTTKDHLALTGLLNSSAACAWLKQVCHNKGARGIGGGFTAELWEQFVEITATAIGQFPIPREKPLDLATQLHTLAQERQQHLPDALAALLPMPRPEWVQHRSEADQILRKMIALQEELDWRCYRLYGITDDELTYQDAGGQPLMPPEIKLGERTFEIVLARRMAEGEEDTTWFRRHGSTPITEIPSHWPEDYRRLVEQRIERIEDDRYVGLVERPEYKRRWNTEPWDEQANRALEAWLKSRLEDAAYWPEPELQTTRSLADRAQRDADFMAVAELYRGQSGFDVHTLVRQLVEDEAVPFLPVLRYKPSGLRKRKVWERTWKLQRQEDASDAAVERELVRREGETEQQFKNRIQTMQKRHKQEEVGDIPRPPNYSKSDFADGTYWSLRGKLDVPKERFVSYPFCSKDNDPSLLVGWAGWNHLQQAQALAAWLTDAVEREGWTPERLTPLLAGLDELIPWLKQWHNELDPSYNQRLGDFFETFLESQLHQHGLTGKDLKAWNPPRTTQGRRRKKKA